MPNYQLFDRRPSTMGEGAAAGTYSRMNPGAANPYGASGQYNYGHPGQGSEALYNAMHPSYPGMTKVGTPSGNTPGENTTGVIRTDGGGPGKSHPTDMSWVNYTGQPTQPRQPFQQVTIMGGQSDNGDDWYKEAQADAAAFRSRLANMGGGTTGTGHVFPEQSPEFFPVAAPDVPDYQAREYAPPEEDPGIYNAERSKAMGQGLRSLRNRTQEAMLMSRSLDNPQARQQFVRNALEGYGRGLESVAAGASREARTQANTKRAEQLRIYNSKYKALSAQDMTNYQNKLNKIASDFAQAQTANATNYQNRAGQYANGGSTYSPTGGSVHTAVNNSYANRLQQIRANQKRFSWI